MADRIAEALHQRSLAFHPEGVADLRRAQALETRQNLAYSIELAGDQERLPMAGAAGRHGDHIPAPLRLKTTRTVRRISFRSWSRLQFC